MALSDAIAMIADQMDEDANNTENAGGMFAYALHSYARQLRTAVKAADGGQPASTVPPELQHRMEIDKARAELREQKKKAAVEEDYNGMALCVGGAADGTTAPIAGMPEGAKAMVGSEVYELKAGKLVFVVGGK